MTDSNMGINVYQGGYDPTWKNSHGYEHIESNGSLSVPMPLRAEAAALVNAQYESFGEIEKGDLISLENRFDMISDFWREIANPNYWEAYNALNHNDAKTVEDFVRAKEIYLAGWHWICETSDLKHEALTKGD